MAKVTKSIPITNNYDLIGCLGITALSYFCINQFEDVIPQFIHEGLKSSGSRALTGFSIHATLSKGDDEIRAADTYSYWAVSALFEHTARSYSNQHTKSHIGLVCVYFATSFGMECFARKVAGYKYNKPDDKQTLLLLKYSFFSACIKTVASLAGEFIPVALGFKNPDFMKSIIQSITTGAVQKALDKIAADHGYREK